jgi:DNA-binding MarR family transcriptional regulator
VGRQPHQADRRRNVVGLPRKGEDVVRRASLASDEAERALLAPLKAVDAKRLRELLRIVVDHHDPRPD